MEMISIAAIIKDDAGMVFVPVLPETKTLGGSRRISRAMTLDGGCHVYDGGFSHGDRTFDIVTPYDADRWTVLWNLTQNHAQVTISTREGKFLGTIQDLFPEEKRIRIRILIKEKLTA